MLLLVLPLVLLLLLLLLMFPADKSVAYPAPALRWPGYSQGGETY